MVADHEQILCRMNDISDPGSRGFLPYESADRVFAVRKGLEIFVYLNICPHQIQPMEFMRHQFLNSEKTEIMCFAHGAHFDIRTGECIKGMCEGYYLTPISSRIENGAVVIPRSLPSRLVKLANNL